MIPIWCCLKLYLFHNLDEMITPFHHCDDRDQPRGNDAENSRDSSQIKLPRSQPLRAELVRPICQVSFVSLVTVISQMNQGRKGYLITVKMKLLYWALRSFPVTSFGMHSIVPKTASANTTNAKVRNRQMIGRPIII